jgi:hypothetical protein
MESGAVWDDPSEDLLYDLLGVVERGNEQFVVVERTSDPSGQTYVQAIRRDEGGWLLERRGERAHRGLNGKATPGRCSSPPAERPIQR